MTTFLSGLWEYLTSIHFLACCCNLHLIPVSIICSSLGPWESQNTVNKSTSAEGCDIKLLKKEIMCASIACSAVWFLVHTDELKFHLPIDGANQEVITFMVVRLQKSGPDVLVVAFVLFCQMVGHPLCENFQGCHAIAE